MRLIARVVLAILLLTAIPLSAGWQQAVDSPDGTLRAEINLDDDGRFWYQLLRVGDPIIQRSPLGISLHNTAFTHGLAVVSKSPIEAVSENLSLTSDTTRFLSSASPLRSSPTVRNAHSSSHPSSSTFTSNGSFCMLPL